VTSAPLTFVALITVFESLPAKTIHFKWENIHLRTEKFFTGRHFGELYGMQKIERDCHPIRFNQKETSL
jgi:hypothetical protein